MNVLIKITVLVLGTILALAYILENYPHDFFLIVLYGLVFVTWIAMHLLWKEIE